MENTVTHPVENIIKITIPFEDDFTSVFVLKVGEKCAVFDSATTKYDVDNYIMPSLKAQNISPDILISSHFHGDHMGGEGFLAEYFPNALRAKMPHCGEAEGGRKMLCDGEMIFDALKVIHLPGHSDDAMGIIDTRTKTLLSADCLQLYGVGRYGTGIAFADKYLESIKKLRNTDVENIIASHEYAPLGASAFGKEAVKRYLDECESYIYKLKSYAEEKQGLSADEISKLYNGENKSLPPVPTYTFEGALKI